MPGTACIKSQKMQALGSMLGLCACTPPPRGLGPIAQVKARAVHHIAQRQVTATSTLYCCSVKFVVVATAPGSHLPVAIKRRCF